MTGRELLSRRVRFVGMAFIVAFVSMVSGIVAATQFNQPAALEVVAPIFVICVFAVVIAQFLWLRCPWCRANLAQLLLSHLPAAMSSRLRCCPYCEHRFDEELPESGGQTDSDRTERF